MEVKRKVQKGIYGYYINLKGREYDASHLDVKKGQVLTVTLSDEGVTALNETLPLITRDEWGFPDRMPVLGDVIKE